MNVRVNVNKKNKKEVLCAVLCYEHYRHRPLFFTYLFVQHGHIQRSIESFERRQKIYYCKNLVIFSFVDRERGLLGMSEIE